MLGIRSVPKSIKLGEFMNHAADFCRAKGFEPGEIEGKGFVCRHKEVGIRDLRFMYFENTKSYYVFANELHQ
jgi:hypothetical protein